MTESSRTSRTWFITGAGRDLGREFARAALDQGDRVVGTVRRAEAMSNLLADHPNSAREILLDVHDAAAVAVAVDHAASIFGGLDVVINNAGKWALEGFSEALSAEVVQFGIHVTIAQLGGFATDWAGSSMQFAAPKSEYDELHTTLSGTVEIPWPAVDADSPMTDADPRLAAELLVGHLSGADRPLRVLIGDDAPAHAAVAYAARRDSYGTDNNFSWPS